MTRAQRHEIKLWVIRWSVIALAAFALIEYVAMLPPLMELWRCDTINPASPCLKIHK